MQDETNLCPSCNGEMHRDESTPIEGGVMMRCGDCDHMTPIWADEEARND